MTVQTQVYLVGAGPGDPDMITVRGMQALRSADVVLYDRLIDPTLLREARADAELIYVGKSKSHHALPQFAINSLLIDRAIRGKTVVRLECGDPFTFGHGAEEALALAGAGIPFEVVSGVLSAVAVPESVGIPLTHEQLSCTATLVGDRENIQSGGDDIDWAALAACKGTVVFSTGVSKLPVIVKQLVENGRPIDTPAAVIECGAGSQPHVVVGTLADIHERTHAAQVRPTVVVVVGEVVNIRERLFAASEA